MEPFSQFLSPPQKKKKTRKKKTTHHFLGRTHQILTLSNFSVARCRFGELCLGRGPELLQHVGECFRQILAGTLRCGSKALCRPDRQGAITYRRPEISDNFANKTSEHVHATRRETSWGITRGLQLSEIENCAGYIPLHVLLYASNTVIQRDYENCCPRGLLFNNKVFKCACPWPLLQESRAQSKFKHESTGQRS